MPECHNCKWNGEPPTEAKAAACHKCVLPPDRVNHKGKVWVSLDADGGRRRQTLAEAEIAMRRTKEEDGGENQLPDCCRKTALALLDYMDGLTPKELKLLVAVAHGATLAEIAKSGILGKQVTRQGTSGIWRNIVRKFPDLAPVLAGGRPARPHSSP